MGKIERIESVIGNKTLIIRHGEVGDAEKLVGLVKKLDEETTFLMRELDEFTLTVEQEEEYIQSQLDSEVNLFIIAELDRKIIGSCGINGSTRRRLRHTANLGVAVEKEYWGIGIGKKLMQTGIEWAKENGISRITLQVDTKNYRAINLYLKLGFEIEGTLRNDKLLADGTYISSYTMALML